MNDRQQRYQSFDKFRENAKELFTAYSKSERNGERLDGLYSFCVCPGGRYGGNNKKVIEVFYGNRPFDSVKKIGENLQPTTKLETAHGATLSYQRTDDGQVLCSLYPAASENYHPAEDFILLGIVKNPAELRRKSKRHWKLFLAYMESTCLDGKPSITQKLRMFYLRNFKEHVINKTLQKRKISVFASDIAKYTLTVGLSGFVILIVTWAKDAPDKARQLESQHEIKSICSNILTSVESISESTKAIESKIEILNRQTDETLKSLSAKIITSNAQLVKAMSELEKYSEFKANDSEMVSD